MSPYVDLTLAGTTMETKRDVDPLLSRELLQPRVADYTPDQDVAGGLIPHVFQAYTPMLDEAAAALDRAGQLLSAHLASAERIAA